MKGSKKKTVQREEREKTKAKNRRNKNADESTQQNWMGCVCFALRNAQVIVNIRCVGSIIASNFRSFFRFVDAHFLLNFSCCFVALRWDLVLPAFVPVRSMCNVSLFFYYTHLSCARNEMRGRAHLRSSAPALSYSSIILAVSVCLEQFIWAADCRAHLG